MWTPREKELYTLDEIAHYLNDVNSFHDYRLGTFEYNSKNSTVNISVETEHDAKESSTEGLIWEFCFEGVKNISFSMDIFIGTWIYEIEVNDCSEIIFSLTNGYISVSAEKIKFSIPEEI